MQGCIDYVENESWLSNICAKVVLELILAIEWETHKTKRKKIDLKRLK
jgi:hypothetical protein